MKFREELKEFRAYAAPDLRHKIQDFEEELMKLRFRKAAGEVRHSDRLKVLRHNIARVKTILNEQQQLNKSGQ